MTFFDVDYCDQALKEKGKKHKNNVNGFSGQFFLDFAEKKKLLLLCVTKCTM